MSRVPVDKLRAEVQASGLDPYELAALDSYAEQRHSRNPDRTPTEH